MPDRQPDNTSKLQFKRDEDFASLYANNIRFEGSAWDLRLIFGLLDQTNPSATVVEQHTSMSVAWPSAKIALFHLIVNILVIQRQTGTIQLRPDVIPPRPNPSDPEVTPQDKPFIEYLAWIHDQIFSDRPYVPPTVAELLKEAERVKNG